MIGVLVDRRGFPLEVTCWEGNKAETATNLPTVRAPQERHGVADMVVVADAGMLSATDLKELDAAELRFIVGSRQTKAPADLSSHFRWHADTFTDGQLIDTITPRHAATPNENAPNPMAEPVWDPVMHPKSWRAVWAYTTKRAARDGRTLTLQKNRAKAVVAGKRAAHTPRFVTIHSDTAVLDEASLPRAQHLARLKGYVTNIPATALAVTHHLQQRTQHSINNISHTLRPLHDATIHIASNEAITQTTIPPQAQTILDALTH
ncbi:IS1634 family transposase ISBli9 [Austwickia sp. TVS 96-490-7B]|nr:hypothetical protein [Austwickia sp. TVS 96-490-7B]MBW3083990.1 IS1634 family transposase ISBli9 [Austwickia sp. TVS 96-490-7B]